MRQLRGTPRRGSLSWRAGILAALALARPAAALLAPSAPAWGETPPVPPEAARAEVRFPALVRYAIFRQTPGEVRMLVTRGDLLFHPQDPTRAVTVVRVETGAVVLRESPRGRGQALEPGDPLPGFSGFTFTGTVLLNEVHYRYRAVDRIAHPDPVVMALEGTRAVLEVEVLRSPAPAGEGPAAAAATPSTPQPSPPDRAILDGSLLEKVRVKEVSPGLYEVPATDAQVVLENAGRVLTDLWPTVQPSLSLQTGLEYRISSAAGDGVLSGKGFTLTAPKLAARVGLQAGDTILSVNGQPVDGFASLYGIFQAVRRDPALRTVQVELDRRGSRITKTYQIR